MNRISRAAFTFVRDHHNDMIQWRASVQLYNVLIVLLISMAGDGRQKSPAVPTSSFRDCPHSTPRAENDSEWSFARDRRATRPFSVPVSRQKPPVVGVWR